MFVFCCCQYNPKDNSRDLVSFWGDSTLTVTATNQPEGYDISVFGVNDLCILHIQKDSSINRYIALQSFPESWNLSDVKGVQKLNLEIPTKTTLEGEVFFMDVNFDGEKDLVVRRTGYNRWYYFCYDLVNDDNLNRISGLLEPLTKKPYNNLVGQIYEEAPCSTTFDYNSKTIIIEESLGCCTYEKTIASYEKFEQYSPPYVQIVHKEIGSISVDGESKEVYDLIDGVLQLTEKKFIPSEAY